jgi:hypothetical protein
MKLFQELGAEIERQWRDLNYAEQDFAPVAAAALYAADLVNRVDPWEIVRWVHETPNLPHQVDLEARFGNPPITLYAGPRFYIDVYFWLDGTTEIHQHSFSGAFQVLLGSSIHSHYFFEKQKEVNPHFLLGQVEMLDVKLLAKGDIQQIVAGPSYIHALFHLDRPSATITVRTSGSPAAQPQFSYKKPHVAFDPFYKDPTTIRKLQTQTLLYSMSHPEADDFTGNLINNSDFQTAFLVLENAFGHLRGTEIMRMFGFAENTDRFDVILKKARAKHGALVDKLPAVFAESERMMDIIKRRSTITSEEHRFFLALLLNVSDRKHLLELVGARFSNESPFETVLDWVDELYRTRVLGSSEENALGIKGFDGTYLLVLDGLLHGMSSAEICQSIENETAATSKHTVAKRVELIIQSLKKSHLFSAILQS